MKKLSDRFSAIKKIGLEKSYFADNYHRVLVMSWSRFLFFYVLIFVLFNLAFAFLFGLAPDSVSGTNGEFFKNFAFSVQTFTTVGYGLYAPLTTFAHILVILESILSVLAMAFLTGLAFAKLSRPIARVQFTNQVIIVPHNGQPTLMFRLANLRGNQIAEAVVKAVVLKSEVSREGHSMRTQNDVIFKRSSSSFFILTWTVMHTIDETSPFYGLSQKDLIAQNIEMSVSVMGYDETYSQTVHASCVYAPEDFIFDKRFADLILSAPNGAATAIDYTKFDQLL